MTTEPAEERRDGAFFDANEESDSSLSVLESAENNHSESVMDASSELGGSSNSSGILIGGSYYQGAAATQYGDATTTEKVDSRQINEEDHHLNATRRRSRQVFFHKTGNDSTQDTPKAANRDGDFESVSSLFERRDHIGPMEGDDIELGLVVKQPRRRTLSKGNDTKLAIPNIRVSPAIDLGTGRHSERAHHALIRSNSTCAPRSSMNRRRTSITQPFAHLLVEGKRFLFSDDEDTGGGEPVVGIGREEEGEATNMEVSGQEGNDANDDEGKKAQHGSNDPTKQQYRLKAVQVGFLTTLRTSWS
jgi:hypothetical protein